MAPICTLMIFDLDDEYFGLDATLVRETLWLPELTPVEEAPVHIVGMFNLRDQFVPVTDLKLRFGHPPRPYNLDDQVVVIEQDQLLMGLIVSEVREVIEVPLDAIHPAPKFDVDSRNNNSLVSGEIRVGDDIVTLLDTSQLVRQPQNLTITPIEQASHRFCPEATPEQHAVYRARAKALMQAIAEEEGSLLALAVVELGGEYFGIALEAVQEFCEIAYPSPIPCCPPHILGAISLRGNLLNLLDLRVALNLSASALSNGKVVIARASSGLGTGLGEQVIGISVDEVHEVIYMREDELQDAPALLREQRGTEIKGTVPYAGKMLVVLDLPALLAREEWIVNESV